MSKMLKIRGERDLIEVVKVETGWSFRFICGHVEVRSYGPRAGQKRAVCGECRKAPTENASARYQRKHTLQGLCTYCPRAPRPGRKLCAACAARIAGYQRAKAKRHETEGADPSEQVRIAPAALADEHDRNNVPKDRSES